MYKRVKNNTKTVILESNTEMENIYILIDQIQNGDELAFEQLLAIKSRSILYQATRIMQSKTEGEDVAQEVVLRMYQNFGSLRDPKTFNGWLRRIIVNECNRMIRNNYTTRRTMNIDDYGHMVTEKRYEFLPDEYAEKQETRNLILEIIETLPKNQGEAIFLHYYNEMTFAEIASTMDLSINTVGSHIRRAKKRIKKDLEKRTGEKIKLTEKLVVMPVLSKVFSEQANLFFSDEKVQMFIDKCHATLETVPPLAASTTVTRAAYRSAAQSTFKSGFSAAAKAVVAVAASVAIAVVGLFYVTNNSTQTPPTAIIEDSRVPLARAERELPKEQAVVAAGDFEAATEPDGLGSIGVVEPEVRLETSAPNEHISETPYLKTPILGNVYIVDNTGNLLDGEDSVSNLTILLKDSDGNEVAATSTDANGSYAFTDLLLAHRASFTIAVVLPKDGMLAATIDHSEGRKVTDVTPGVAANVQLYLKKGTVAETGIVFTGGDCACGHVNPKQIEISGGSVEWEIIRDHDNKMIASGTTSTISGALTDLYNMEGNGTYTLSCVVTDSLNYKEARKIGFRIYTGEIEENQFA